MLTASCSLHRRGTLRRARFSLLFTPNTTNTMNQPQQILRLLTLAALGTAAAVSPCANADGVQSAGPAPNANVATRPLFTKPPTGAIVLFDGKDTSKWEHAWKKPCAWKIANGEIEVVPRTGYLFTKEKYGDFQLHLEFCVPSMPDKKGQQRGNSGVKLHGVYEIQILDSVDNPTYKAGGCGSIYTQKEPDSNVSRAPGEWQSYDITFRGPRFDDSGKVTELPRVTLVWNGVRVHNDVEIIGITNAAARNGTLPKSGPVSLQDHGCPVKFRNIWIVPAEPAKP
jgi:hypothetical protein